MQLLASLLSHLRHGEGFPRAGLSIGKASHDAVFEQRGQKGLDLILVDVITRLLLREDIIELEIIVFDVLGDSIYFVLTLMDHYFGV